ncbi:MAG: hypothetical protein B7Y12_25235, partial [Rhizobiales bacterium 24-66-13]
SGSQARFDGMRVARTPPRAPHGPQRARCAPGQRRQDEPCKSKKGWLKKKRPGICPAFVYFTDHN